MRCQRNHALFRQFAHDDALATDNGIDQRRFADVEAADDGNGKRLGKSDWRLVGRRGEGEKLSIVSISSEIPRPCAALIEGSLRIPATRNQCEILMFLGVNLVYDKDDRFL
jgi:hypothetical protein